MSSNHDFKNQKWVKRLITVPEVIYNEHIKILLSAYGIQTPNKDFDVYTFIEIKDFIEKSSPAFRTALIGNLLDAVGIQLSFLGENGTLPSVTINSDKRGSAEETIKSIVRKREYDGKVKNYFKDITIEGSTRAIDDVKARNENE